MYRKLPNLVLGFHGCKREIYEKVVLGGEHLKASSNVYDWLGHGIYFWEQNYQRAYEWAYHRYGNDAEVIGAVIDLGNCLNMTDSASSEILRQGYVLLKFRCETIKTELPQNIPSSKTKDVLLRNLDCAVIQQIHDYNKTTKKAEFDSVRGVFTEGTEVYPGSQFLEKTHIQICICNPNCIKGYFSPMPPNEKYVMP